MIGRPRTLRRAVSASSPDFSRRQESMPTGRSFWGATSWFSASNPLSLRRCSSDRRFLRTPRTCSQRPCMSSLAPPPQRFSPSNQCCMVSFLLPYTAYLAMSSEFTIKKKDLVLQGARRRAPGFMALGHQLADSQTEGKGFLPRRDGRRLQAS